MVFSVRRLLRYQLDLFRERAGRLPTQRVREAACLLILRLTAWRGGGYLWWRRWSSQDEVSADILMDDDDMVDDLVGWRENVEREGANWSTGRSMWRGDEYSVSWAARDESRRVRDDVFQLW